jgi:hypothetical protein
MMEDVAEETRKQVELPWYVQARQMTLAPRWSPPNSEKSLAYDFFRILRARECEVVQCKELWIR